MRKSVELGSLFVGAMLAGAAWAGPSTTTAFYGCDFNNDGKADVAAASSSSIRIQLLDGATVMHTGFISNGGGTQTMAACGDVNGDGIADIALNTNGFIKIQLMALDGSGNPVPGNVGFIGNGGNTFTAKALADIDGDKKADLIASGTNFTRVQILGLDGSGNPVATSTGFVSDGGGVYVFKLAADFNKDGKADLAGSSAGAANVRITPMNGITPGTAAFIGTGGGTFALGPNGSGDLDGDGAADLIMDGATTSKAVTIDPTTLAPVATGFPGNGGGSFPFKLATDLDGDGKADLVGNGTGLVRLQLMNGVNPNGAAGFFGNGGGSYPAIASGFSSGNTKGNLFGDGGATTGFFRVSLVNGTTPPTNGFIGNGAGAFALPPGLPQVPNP